MQYQDMYGNPLEVGDVITYPVRWGSSMWMSTAVIRELTTVRRWYTRDNDEGMPFAKTTAIIPDGYGHKVSGPNVTYHTTRTTFECFDRCIKVDPEQLPGDMGRWVIRILEDLQPRN